MTPAPAPAPSSTCSERSSTAFSYVGVCQPGSLYSVIAHILGSRRARGAQARASGSHSSTAMCPAISRVSSIFSDTAPGRPLRSNASP